MKPDKQIQDEIIAGLNADPVLVATEIGVAVKDGIVTLCGLVENNQKKEHARLAAMKVQGARAIAINIRVRLSQPGNCNDTELAGTVVDAFKLNNRIPIDRLKIWVEYGWITLDGEVEWLYQKEAITKTLGSLQGIRGVTNGIVVIPRNYLSTKKQTLIARQN